MIEPAMPLTVIKMQMMVPMKTTKCSNVLLALENQLGLI